MMNALCERRLVWGIVVVAVALRLILALAHPFWFPDSVDYDALAQAMAHGRSYQVNGLFATRMPGYPMFVAAVYALCGPSVKAVLVVQAFMGGAATWLVYGLGRRISSGTAVLAAALAAIDPLSIGFSAAFLSESAFTLLMLAALWMIVRWTEDGRFGGWIATGLTWGAAVYMRASALWCIVPLAAWAAFMRREQTWAAGKWRGPVLAVVLVLLSLLPWQLRNEGIFHERLFRLTTLEGISLYEAVYPGADGSPKQDVIALPPEMRGLNEAQRDDEWGRRAWQFMRADPLRMAGLGVRKIGRTWSPWLNATEFRNAGVQAAMLLWHVPLFLFGLIGLFSAAISTRLKGLLLLPILYFTAVHSIFLGSVRYRVPLMPLVCLFAAAGAMAVVKWLGGDKRPTAPRV